MYITVYTYMHIAVTVIPMTCRRILILIDIYLLIRFFKILRF